MPFTKGSHHSEATRRKMSETRRGVPHNAEHKAAISAANKGRVFPRKYERTCPCGVTFKSAVSNAKFHSRPCSRAARGHGLRHAPAFARFAKRCAICATTDQLVGDHDHATGSPRGILCRKCNLALGNMDDDPQRLRAAAAYLEAQ